LVLAGQFFVKRAEDKRVWLIRLQEAASDLATSYLQQAATANDRRRTGVDMSQVETATNVVDRQKALGRFRTLPWSSDFEAHRQAMGRGIEGVWRAWDESDDEFQLAYKKRPVGSLRVHGRGRCTDPPGRRLSVSIDDLPQPLPASREETVGWAGSISVAPSPDSLAGCKPRAGSGDHRVAVFPARPPQSFG
jgi:hypothetical protein